MTACPTSRSELAADAVTERDEFAAPEEAALAVRDSVPGATDHDDQHGVEQDRSDERLSARSSRWKVFARPSG